MKHTLTTRSRSRARVAVGALVVAGLLAACNSGSDDSADTAAPEATTAATEPAATEAPAETTADTTADTTGDTTGDTTADTEAPGDDVVDQTLTGDAPGVTDDTVKVGVTYVDTEALKAIGLDYDLGQHQAVYEALFADINDNGGINGRQIEPVITGIDPTNAAGAEAACLAQTEDDDVFLVTGFFLNDAVMCPLEVHGTALVGGSITPELGPRAQAPWAAWLASSSQQGVVTQEFGDRGVLDGTLGVYFAVADQPDYETDVKPVLDELGIVPVSVGVNDAPTDDRAASEARVRLIAEQFKAANVDTILVVGIGATPWMSTMQTDTSYRPQLLFTEVLSARSFYTSADTTDTSILEGSLAGGGFGPDQARFDTESFQECVAVLTAAGLDTPAPDQFDPDDASNQPYQAAFQACPDVALIKALLTRAGENLNYGTLAAAIDGLTITIPGDPDPRTYGPPPSNGNPPAYIYRWDEATQSVILDEG